MRSQSIEPLERRTLLSTFYVATTGNNSAAGSSGAPWRTLQYAADHVGPGDTVIVAPGNYTGFDIRHSGTANARIVFKAQSGAVINAVNTKTNRDGINIENASYITIDGFTLTGTNDPATSRAGIRVVGDGFDTGEFSKFVIVQNNTADRWGQWGIFTAFADDITIADNVCSRSAQQHGIYFSNSADRPVIRNNVCWGNANCGIHMNGDIETGNTDLPNVDGIITGALVDGNTCYDNGAGSAFGAGGGSAINCDGVRNSRIQNNLLYDNHASGISLYRIDGGGASVGNVVANNTIINAADSRWCLNITDGATGTSVFNNILFNLNTSSVRGSISISADSAAGLVSDYNLLDTKFSHSDNVVNFATWRSLTGGDAHSSTMTLAAMQALFANYAAKDFSLASSSAAIDKGTNAIANGASIAAPTIDHNKAHRPAGNGWDIGAFERQTLANFAILENGALVVQGTGGGDSIGISVRGSQLAVTRNGVTMKFSNSRISSIDIHGNDGDDAITIGAGPFGAGDIGVYVNAGSGNDTVRGGDGRDTISGGAGKDSISGGAGDDLLVGNQGPDRIFGEGGKDRLYGGDGDDLLDGGSHDDRLWSDAGRNTLYGQGGNDIFYCRNGALDSLFGASGTDGAQIDTMMDVCAAIESLLT